VTPEVVLAPGARVVVRDEEWLVRSSVPVGTGGYAVRVVGMSELVRNQERSFLTALDDITEMRPEDTDLVADNSPQYRRSRLYLESLLRRTPPTDDKVYLGHQAALNFARYQLVPAHRALAALRPSVGIFDGVGIGKTLEVGILLSELIKRGRGERILVVALKSILAQFQQELWARFAIPLVRLDTEGLQRVRAKVPANKNPFYYFNRAIISIDTLKNDGRYRTYLEQCHWDVIVIDECHHVANADAQRGRLASLLARTCDSLLLTSATPHNGKPEGFANLMNMLEPTAVADPSNYTKDEIKGLFVRRFKKDIEDEVGQHFKERKTEARTVQASAAEEKILTRIKGLKFHTLNRKSPGQDRDILFSTTLLKAFLSSPYACLETVQNRLESIARRLADTKTSLALRRDLESDQQVLCMFKDQLEMVVGGEFSKLKRLGGYLDSIGWTGKSERRVIVFSERIRTLEVIRDFLKAKYSVRTDEDDKDKGKVAVRLFHAGLPDTEQMQIVEDFGKQDSPVRILLATDVASEGVNLHFFCNHLVHFDIPWSLITLEQRNGRIDRYGQENTPHIVYLVTTGTAQDIKDDLTILMRLIEKEQTAHKNLGDAATILRLYDAHQEEEYVEAGLSAGQKPEQILPDQPEDQGFLDLLLGSDAAPPAEDCRGRTPTLYPDDLAFVKAAFDEIKAAETDFQLPDFHPTLPSLTFSAPDDLWHRCQYLPRESLPRGREFLLTTDRGRVQRAIAEARRRAKEGESSWPREQLLWELHPVLQWLLDKVMCRFQRHEAPVVVAPKLGKGRAAYLFQGLLSNKRSQPVVVEWFAVYLRPGRPLEVGPFGRLLGETGFEQGLANTGQESRLTGAVKGRLPQAVEAAKQHMRLLGEVRSERLRQRVEEDRERFEAWLARSRQQIDKDRTHYQAVYVTVPRNLQERLQGRRRNIDERKQQRERWLTDTFTVVGTPYLKLAAVFVGE
jgi:ERCC4-related helicase